MVKVKEEEKKKDKKHMRVDCGGNGNDEVKFVGKRQTITNNEGCMYCTDDIFMLYPPLRKRTCWKTDRSTGVSTN